MAITIGVTTLTDGGLNLMEKLILNNHQKHFGARHWTAVTDAAVHIFEVYLPGNLDELVAKITSHPASPALLPHAETNASTATISFPANLHDGVNGAILRAAEPIGIHLVARQCSLQLLFLDLMRSLLIKTPGQSIMGPDSTIPVASLNYLLGLLLRSYEFAISFNANMPLREVMVHTGFAKTVEELVLNRQETGAILLLVESLFSLYRRGLLNGDLFSTLREDHSALTDMATRLFEVSITALRRFVELRLPNETRRRTGKAWTEVVSTVLSQWRTLVDILDDKSKKDQALAIVAERSFETQIVIALEVFAVADKASTVVLMAREFVLAATGRLARLRLATL
jgi:hypothetical protein